MDRICYVVAGCSRKIGRQILFGHILTRTTSRQIKSLFMDEIVIRAMAKWPNVPAVYGWLALDRRGQWSIKSTAPPASNGAAASFEPDANPKLIEFIGRNYTHDDEGRWFFQNGPQRVYVALAYAPFVYRIVSAHPLTFETHAGASCTDLQSAWMDEAGNLLFVTEHGPGLLLDRDLPRGLEALSYADGHMLEEERLLALIDVGDDATGVYFNTGAASLPLTLIRSDEAPQRFGYIREPQPPVG